MLKAYPGKVVVHQMERGEARTNSGIVLGNDEGTTAGIRARWAKVYSKGDDITDIKVGDWILVEHGRWTLGIHYEDDYLYMVDWPNAIHVAATQEEMPEFKAVSAHQSATEHSFRPEDFEEYVGDKILQ